VSLWRHLAHGVRALRYRRVVDAELDEEVRDYYERARADLIHAGLTPEEATREARRELGSVERAREELRAYGWEIAFSATLADVRHALRRLRQSPTFATVAILTLALGIGATTAIVSAVVPILFRALPYPDADRVVMLNDRDPAGAPVDVTYGTFVEVAARSRSFTELAATDRWQPALGGDEPEQIVGTLVTARYFRVLGVAPALGRELTESDDAFGAPRVVVVSDAFAKRRFGSARAILNRALRLDGAEYTVVGVMPSGFANVLAPAAEVWAARQFREQAPLDAAEWGHHMRMVGRLAPGVSVEQARSELAAIGDNALPEFPRPAWAALERGLIVDSLRGSITADARPVLLALLGAVLLLLVIACANVANLLLARGVARRAELAVRVALGAGRGRLVRQLLTESLVLAALGGALGFAVAAAGVRGIVALAPEGLPRVEAIALDLPAFAVALGVTVVVGVAVGLKPALLGTRHGLRVDPHFGLRTIGTQHTLRRALVVTEVALALVLLTGAGLLLRSVDRLLATAPGFDPKNALTLRIVAVDYRAKSAAETAQFFRTALDAVRAVPGVRDAALTSQLPLSGDLEGYGLQFERPAPGAGAANETASAMRYTVTPGWFATLRIPLKAGRLLGAQDVPGAPEAVLINESFAKRWFGDRDPVGERLRIGPEIGQPDRPWDVVVGVVGDVKQTSLALDAPNAFYVAMGQWAWVDATQSIVVRTDGDPLALLPAVKRAIWSVDATPALARITTMEQLLKASEAERRFALTVFAIFAAAALALSALGLYGVIAGNVAERTREIGLRSALGATPGAIVALVLRQGMSVAAVGVGVGLLGAALLTRSLTTLLYRTAPLDPATVASVVALLGGICAAACLVPAWRAARVDPTIALRGE
jgi:putative ABC transport system permease protein